MTQESFLVHPNFGLGCVIKKMVDYDFVEIGTCDFDTYIQSCGEETVGLSIDPLQIYLDKLPNRKYVKKICAAITGTIAQPQNNTVDVYYIKPTDIETYKLPDWLRGCNSVFKKHPTTERILQENKLEHLLQTEKVPLLTIDQLFSIYCIQSIRILKLDTEGHDCDILQGLIEYSNRNTLCWPQEIVFEANCLTPDAVIENTLKVLLERYTLISRNENIHLQINNNGRSFA